MTTAQQPRVLASVAADLKNSPIHRVKYGVFFDALSEVIDLVGVVNANLRGLPKWLNMATTFDFDVQRWREYYYKNVRGFQLRSRQVARTVENHEYDVLLQLGVLFDPQPHITKPTIIYTDYTAYLSRQKREVGRSPMLTDELSTWLVLERDAYHNAAHVFTRGDFVRNSIIRDYGVDPAKVTAIGGGINLPALPAPPAAQKASAPTVLYMSKEFARKGGELVLRAFARVHAQLPTAQCIVITNDRITAPPGVDVLYGPDLSHTDIQRIMARSHIFALPAHLETWGDALLEAMAFGVVPVVSKSDGLAEIVEHGKSGFVIAVGDETALTQHMHALLADTELHHTMQAAAYHRVSQSFTWPVVVNRMLPALRLASASR